MAFEYTEAEKRQMLNTIRNLEAIINGLRSQKVTAKSDREKAAYDMEISRLENQIKGLRAYMR